MTGAAIVRREAGGTIVLAVHGAFDGASAWALRVAMEESNAKRFVIDLTYADEAFEFAACILAGWVRENRRARAVQIVPGSPEQAFLLAGFGLELVEEEALLPSLPASLALPEGTMDAPDDDPELVETTGRVAGAGPAPCP
jgi:hypothetical protein